MTDFSLDMFSEFLNTIFRVTRKSRVKIGIFDEFVFDPNTGSEYKPYKKEGILPLLLVNVDPTLVKLQDDKIIAFMQINAEGYRELSAVDCYNALLKNQDKYDISETIIKIYMKRIEKHRIKFKPDAILTFIKSKEWHTDYDKKPLSYLERKNNKYIKIWEHITGSDDTIQLNTNTKLTLSTFKNLLSQNFYCDYCNEL